MSISKAFQKPLFMIAEAKSISRAFSTNGSLRPADYPYQQTNIDSILTLDTNEPPRENVYSTLAGYNQDRSAGQQSKELVEQSAKLTRAAELQKQQTRRWKIGDVYAPHDLSPAEMKKWKQWGRPDQDIFDMLHINPLDEYKNYNMMAEFTTSMGRIKHPRDTGLRRVNQRRVAKAIRRGIGMGLIPSVHRHPEMLRRGRRND